MAAPKTIPPARPSGLSGGQVVAAARSAPAWARPMSTEIEVWTDEDYRRATGLCRRLLAANGKVDRAALPGVRAAGAARRVPRDAARAGARRGGARAGEGRAHRLLRRDGAGPRRPSSAPWRRSRPTTSWRPAGATRARRCRAGIRSPGSSRSCSATRTISAHGRQIPGCPALPRALNVLPASSHAATQLPHAAGVAWAAKMQEQADRRARRSSTRSRSSAEDFHAGLNFAAVFRAAGDLRLRQRAGKRAPLATSETIAVTALAYGIAGVRVDGDDVLAVYGVGARPPPSAPARAAAPR